jgi:hypothetical protein
MFFLKFIYMIVQLIASDGVVFAGITINSWVSKFQLACLPPFTTFNISLGKEGACLEK